MSCCGCASRVLKLQSEIRSWKTRLADEKRENKMILRWILAVFGYEVRVDIDKETHGIRLQATENKEAVSKALIKLGLGGVNDGDVGMMVMELKLEDHEYYEPFEEPHDVPEFPILEINSMPTHPQVPLVNTGISSLGHHISQHHTAPTMTITTPMEVTSTPLPVNSQLSTEQEVMYIAGNFEEGATLEGPNGQSYIIVRANEPDDLPMQLDYGVNEEVIGDGSNLFFRPNLSIGASEPQNVINYLSGSAISKNAPVQLSVPTIVTPAPVSIPGPSVSLVPDSVIEQLSSSVFKTSSSSSSFKSNPKKKPSLSSTKQVSHANSSASKSSLKKQRSSGGETNIKIKNVISKALPPPPPPVGSSPKQNQTKNTMNNTKPVNSMQQQSHHSTISSLLENVKIIKPTRQVETFPFTTQPPSSSSSSAAAKTETFQFGLTLREKAEMYVLQKAQESVERVSNGFRCTVCVENRYTYSNFETAMAHAKTHYESKPYKCEYCDELFAIQKELLSHRKTVHPKSKGSNVTTTTTSPSPSTSSTSRFIPQSQPHTTLQLQQQQSTKIMHTQSSPLNVNKSTNRSTTSTGSYVTLTNCSSHVVTTTPNATGGQQFFTYPPQGKTIVVQAPLDNNLLRSGVPISISSEVLAALFGGGGVVSQSSVVATTEPGSMSRMPTIVLQGGNPNNKLPRNLNFSLNNVGGVAYQSVDTKTKTVSASFVK